MTLARTISLWKISLQQNCPKPLGRKKTVSCANKLSAGVQNYSNFFLGKKSSLSVPLDLLKIQTIGYISSFIPPIYTPTLGKYWQNVAENYCLRGTILSQENLWTNCSQCQHFSIVLQEKTNEELLSIIFNYFAVENGSETGERAILGQLI